MISQPSWLLDMIKTILTQHLDDHPLSYLPYAIICYNNSMNSTLGFPSYELILRHKFKTPWTIQNQEQLTSQHVSDLSNRKMYFYQIAWENTIFTKRKTIEKLDQTNETKVKHFNVNDFIFIKETQLKNELTNQQYGIIIQTIQIIVYNVIKLKYSDLKRFYNKLRNPISTILFLPEVLY